MPETRTRKRGLRLLVERLEERELLSTLITGSDPEAALGAKVRPLGELLDNSSLNMVGDDFVISEPLADPEGRENAGAVYVIFGGEHLEATTLEGCVDPEPEQRCQPLERLLSQARAIRIIGARAGDRAGFSVAAVGNVIGDETPDLLIGAPGAERIEGTLEPLDTDRGRVYLIGGDFIVNVWNQAQAKLASGQSLTLADVTIDLRTLDPTATTQPGSWQIYEGARPGDQAGAAVAGIGHGFFVIGAPRAESPSDPADLNRGAIYVIGGNEAMEAGSPRSPGVLNLDDVVATDRGSIVYGPSRGAQLGFSVAGMHDPGLSAPGRPNPYSVDGSPEPDLIVGAPYACEDDTCPGTRPKRPGRVYFLPGTQLANPATRGIYELNNNDDLLLLGAVPVQGAADRDGLGLVVSPAGDFDNDGLSDFMFSAPFRDVEVNTPRGQRILRNAGEVYIVFGREVGGNFSQRVTGGQVTPIPITSFAGSSQPIGVTIQGAAPGDRTGAALAPAGNVRDPQGSLSSADDLVIGAPLADVRPEVGPVLPDAGRVYVLFGTDTYQIASGTTFPLATLVSSPLRNIGVIFEGRMERQFMGTAVAGIGQVHDSPSVGEGDDLAVGSPGADTLKLRSTIEDAGEVELLFGSPVLGGMLIDEVPAGHANPGPFGPQVIVGGYWTGGPDMPPAGSIVQFPLNYGSIGPFSSPYALGGALFYPDRPAAVVDGAGHLQVVRRRGDRVVAVNVTARVEGPVLTGDAAVLTDRRGEIRHVFGVTPAGRLAWYRMTAKGWKVRELGGPRLAEGVEAARVQGGFVVVARTRGGAVVLFSFHKRTGWDVKVLNGSDGPAAPRFSSTPALLVARPASARPWIFLYGTTPNGTLAEVRIVGNRSRVQVVAGNMAPMVEAMAGRGLGRNVVAADRNGELVHFQRVRDGWKQQRLAASTPLVLEAGIAVGYVNRRLFVYAKQTDGGLVEWRYDGRSWQAENVPPHPTGGSVASLLYVSRGGDGALRTLLALDDRGLLVRYARLADGTWDVELGGEGGRDELGPLTVLDLLVELGLKAR